MDIVKLVGGGRNVIPVLESVICIIPTREDIP